MVLVDGHLIGRAVDRGGRRLHEGLHPAGVEDGLEQSERRHHVALPVEPRLGDRLLDPDLRREVEDRVNLLVAEERGDICGAGHIAEDERDPRRHGIAMAARQVVDHDRLVPGVDERLHHVRADEARAAGDQRPHAGFGASAMRWYCTRSLPGLDMVVTPYWTSSPARRARAA